MTVGIGMIPRRESGVLLAADSLMPSLSADGKMSATLSPEKLEWLLGSDIALVISGYTDDAALAASWLRRVVRAALDPYPTHEACWEATREIPLFGFPLQVVHLTHHTATREVTAA